MSTQDLEKLKEIQAIIDSAGKTIDIPHFYFNGMVVSQGISDITFILQLNNQPVAALNCSFTTAKTLSKILDNGIRGLEKLAGREILTADEILKFAQEKLANDDESTSLGKD